MRPPSQYMVETYSGRFVDTKNPQPEQITLEDIAHALANTCRFGGHCRRFYSVAEHAVFVSRRMERRGIGDQGLLAGLHHDDAEAYLGDIPRPMKPLLGKAYERLSARMDDVIIEALGLVFNSGTWGDGIQHPFHHEAVKSADNWSLFVEARHLLPSKGVNWAGSQLEAWKIDAHQRIITPDYWRGGLPPEEAKALYLERHKEVTP
jgi:uncharacterized protein